MTHPDVARSYMGDNYFGYTELEALGFPDRYIKSLRKEPIKFSESDFKDWGNNGHGLFSIPPVTLAQCRDILKSRCRLVGRYWDHELPSATHRVSQRWIMLDLAPYTAASQQPYNPKNKVPLYERQLEALPHDGVVPEAVEVVVALALYFRRHKKWPAKLEGKAIRTKTEEHRDSVVGKNATLLVIVEKREPELRIEPWSKKYLGGHIVLAHAR